jgi:hypothetical protein
MDCSCEGSKKERKPKKSPTAKDMRREVVRGSEEQISSELEVKVELSLGSVL